MARTTDRVIVSEGAGRYRGVPSDRSMGAGLFTATGVLIALSPLLWWATHGRLPAGLVLFGLLGVPLTALGLLMLREARRVREQRVTFDPRARTVRFENFRLMRTLRWPSGPKPELTFAFEDVLWVQRARIPKGPLQLVIATPLGLLATTDEASHFYELARALRAIAQGRPPVYRSPWFSFAAWVLGFVTLLVLLVVGLERGWWDQVLDWIQG
jgi:hypothetical protein